MKGYCIKLGIMVEMKNIETIQMPDLSYIHKGTHTNKRKTYVIYKKLTERDLIINKRGHKFPKEVYVSKRTPARLTKDFNGQVIIDGKKRTKTTPKDGRIQTVDDVKNKEKKNEKITR